MSVDPRPIPKWTALEGTILPGGYEIEQCLSANDSDALFKLRVLGDRFTEALVRVFAPNALPAEQIEWWRHAVTLRHHNLSSPLCAGYTVIDTAQVPFIAYVRPDETLDGVLTERSLTPDETREALSACLNGLDYLHDAGWIHSALAPAEILAFGNDIRLSCTGLRPITQAAVNSLPEAISAPRYLAPESKSANTTPAADIYCLGASLFEVLTRNQFASGCEERIATLSHPFSAIIESCVNPDPHARPSVQQVRTLLNSPAPPRVQKPVSAQLAAETPIDAPKPAVEKAPVVPKPASAVEKPVQATRSAGVDAVASGMSAKVTPAAAPGATATPGKAQSRPLDPSAVAGTAPQPAKPVQPAVPLGAPESPRRRRPLEPEEEPHSESSWFGMPLRKWLYLAAACVALIVILWAFHPKPTRPAPSPEEHLAPTSDTTSGPLPSTANAPNPSQTASQTSGHKPGAKWPAHVAQPAGSVAAAGAQHAEPVAPPATPNASWRVVAYTFNREADAERRVNTLRAEHPAFDARVYSPTGSGSPYLVVLGGPMTKQEAERLRSRAKASGMPRDTFVRNYSR